MAKLEDVIRRGTTASKPAATAVAVGTLYFDTDLDKMQRSSGSAWQDVERADPASSTPAFVGARATNTAGTSIPNDADTVVPFATEDFDSNAFHDLVTNNSRLTVPSGKAGKYLVVLQVATASGGGSGRHLYIMKNGTTIVGLNRYHWGTPNRTWWGNVSAVVDMSVSDYVEGYVNQNSGGALALETTAGRVSFSLTLLGT